MRPIPLKIPGTSPSMKLQDLKWLAVFSFRNFTFSKYKYHKNRYARRSQEFFQEVIGLLRKKESGFFSGGHRSTTSNDYMMTLNYKWDGPRELN